MDQKLQKYAALDSKLAIRCVSEPMDMLVVGIVNISLHRIINKVALAILTAEQREPNESLQSLYYSFPSRAAFVDPLLIRSRITEARVGDLSVTISSGSP